MSKGLVIIESPGKAKAIQKYLGKGFVVENRAGAGNTIGSKDAAEATPDGGCITISARKVDSADSVEICVSDTGCGIAPDILPHVFEPFFTTKGGKGTGLGLSISATYVRRNKGDIRIDSVLNQGTTVSITLPIGQEVSHKAEEQSEIVV